MKRVIKEKKQLWGILILGGLNFFILGLLSLNFFLFLYQNPASPTSQALTAEINKFLSGEFLSAEQFKAIVLSQIIAAGIFLISGLGLLLKKEWGRRLTLYFSFFTVILAAVSVLFRSVLINQAILQVIYPGILIFYFTNKKVEAYFVPLKNKETKEKING
ncbi:MAG: hypothetical protein KAT96_01610 [Candidatus Omnitrophica bacterium]|nr:hypothetical protein [Candidatus Omnitrophota bacterium]